MEKELLYHVRNTAVTLTAGSLSINTGLILANTVRQSFTLKYIYYTFYITDAVTGGTVFNSISTNSIYRNNQNSPLGNNLVQITNNNIYTFSTANSGFNEIYCNFYFAAGDSIDLRNTITISTAATNNLSVSLSVLLGYTLG